MSKKTIAVVTVLTLITTGLALAAFARGGHHGMGGFGHRHAMMLEHMVDTLDLNKAQRDQVFAVLDNARPAMRELRLAFADSRRAFGDLRPTDDDYQTRLSELGTEVGKLASQAVVLLGEARANITALLTEEQREQARQMLQEHRGRHFWKDR